MKLKIGNAKQLAYAAPKSPKGDAARKEKSSSLLPLPPCPPEGEPAREGKQG